MTLNIVIPMAGRGSRFSKVGYEDPKPLIDVNGRKMIEVVVNNLKPTIDHRFIFVCQEEHVKEYGLKKLLNSLADDVVIIPINGITDGAACTVLKAEEYINNSEPLMIANSDQWVDCDIDEYLANINGNDGLIMTMRADHEKWSYVAFDSDRNVEGVVEKVVVSDEATVGIYNFSRGSDFCRYANEMIEKGDMSKGEYYVAPVYSYMAKEGMSIGIHNIGSELRGMYGLGTPEDLEKFCKLPAYKKATDF